jgi:hypothetical protein
MKMKHMLGMLGVMALAAPASATLFEPPEFPPLPPGPGEVIPPNCYLLAVGFISPGDVDYVQAIMPMAADQVIIDVDVFEPGDSVMEVYINGVLFGQNDDDANNPAIDFCGSMTNFFDSAIDLGPLAAGDVIDIGVTGFPDFSFDGSHSQAFEYEVWTYYIPAPSTLAIFGLGLLAIRRR